MSSYSIPRLKPLVEHCSIDRKIYFFHRPGVAVEMVDPSKFIATVCKLMDGKKDINQLREALSPLFPSETTYLDSLLSVLDKEYLLEDAAQNFPR
ncbi:MAG: HesA/MoeB/ThiF family protein, partial [Gammaproteobacteria bacterium]